jgi:hypothetical protein
MGKRRERRFAAVTGEQADDHAADEDEDGTIEERLPQQRSH